MDLITFKSFISTEVLIILYYICSLMLPLVIWGLVNWLNRKYKLLNIPEEYAEVIKWKSLNAKQKIKFSVFLIVAFVFLELFLRVLFEFLIGYMQMRDALLLLKL